MHNMNFYPKYNCFMSYVYPTLCLSSGFKRKPNTLLCFISLLLYGSCCIVKTFYHVLASRPEAFNNMGIFFFIFMHLQNGFINWALLCVYIIRINRLFIACHRYNFRDCNSVFNFWWRVKRTWQHGVIWFNTIFIIINEWKKGASWCFVLRYPAYG